MRNFEGSEETTDPFVERLEHWVADHDTGQHRHLGTIRAMLFTRYEHELPPELVQAVIERTEDPHCSAQLISAGRVAHAPILFGPN